MATMPPLQILMLEDSPVDADLLREALLQAGIAFDYIRVATEADYLAHLSDKLDLILADYSLPQFTAPQALQLLQARGLDIPFIVVTGAVGEEAVVECMKQGAADYLLKDRLARLGQSVVRALADKALRDEQRKVAAEFKRLKVFNENIIQSMTEGIVVSNEDGVITFVNRAIAVMSGYTPEELIGIDLPKIKQLFPTDQHYLLDANFAQRTHVENFRYEIDIMSKDRLRRTLLINSRARFEDGHFTGVVAVLTDITERKQAEENLRRTNRTLAVTSAVNQTIIRIRSLPELFETICRMAIRIGGFRMAWIGLLDNESQKLKPLAAAGVIEDYLDNLNIVLDGGPREKGPTGRTMRTGKHTMSADIEHDPSMAPWRENALRLGYRASGVFPLKLSGRTIGTINLYAAQPDFFDDDELHLLDEMAENISFAMDLADQEAQRHRAEAELQRQHTLVEEIRLFLQTTLDAFPANTVVLAPDGTIINVNVPWIRFAEANNGSAPMHHLGSNYLDICDNASGPQSADAMPTAAGIRAVIHGQQENFTLEYPCDSPTEKRWYDLHVTPFPEPAPRRVVVAHIDITQRKHAEIAQRKQRIFNEALLDSALTITSTLDLDTVMRGILYNLRKVFPHKSANIMLIEGNFARAVYWEGYPERVARFLATNLFSLDTPNLREMITSRAPLLLADTANYPGWIVNPETALTRAYAAAPIQSQGEVIGFLSMDSDEPAWFTADQTQPLIAFANQAAIAIENAQLYKTLQQHAFELEQRVNRRTAELRAAKQRVEIILNNSPEGIIVLSPELKIKQVNPAFAQLLGGQPDDYFNQSILSYIYEDDIPRLTAALVVDLTGNSPGPIEVRTRRKDGTLFYASVTPGQIPDMGLVCTINDITTHKNAEEALRQALVTEKELGELKIRFMSMASHEFRTPLATIMANADTLALYRQRLSEEQIDQKIQSIKNQVHHLTEIMDDVLLLTRMEAHRTSFDAHYLDLDSLFNAIIEEFKSRPEIPHQFDYALSGTVRPLWLDPKLMRQIISNLLSNAVKYSPADKPLILRLGFSPDEVTIEVSDQGIGIPTNEQKHLFEPFYRASNVDTMPGTGLGLVITKNAVEMHGGTISVDSHVDLGTTFVIHIPLTANGGTYPGENPGN